MKSDDNKLNLIDRYFAFIDRRGIFDKLLFYIATIAFAIASFQLILTVNAEYIVTEPARGGVLVEGIIGTPRFVNPVLAITQADMDTASLVFSGLMRIDEKGNLVPDVAESIQISEDGTTYNVQIRRDILFHDGNPLTASDFAFTIALIQDPDLKSPLRGEWNDVDVEIINDYEIQITLDEPHVPFMENLTVGILQRALWSELPIEQIPFSHHNTESIGTGPYQISDSLRSSSGLIKAFRLTPHPYSPQARAKISTIVLQFYQNENEILKALNDKKISSSPSLSAKVATNVNTDHYDIIKHPLPRTFGIFLNQNRSASLRDQSVRRALSEVIDRNILVEKILHSNGIPIHSPIPPDFLAVESPSLTEYPETKTSTTTTENRQDIASQHLRNGGWSKTEDNTWKKEIDEQDVEIHISLVTANNPMFEAVASYIAEQWESIGIKVTITQYEEADLVQSILRPRDFEAVLYGADIKRGIDLYPFWHSSQKSDPGLNIAQYTNIDADSLLEKIGTQTDTSDREKMIREFEQLIITELPAIFLFAATFTHVIDKDIHTSDFRRLGKPSDRFANIHEWHVNSKRVWPIFIDTENYR